MSVERHFVFDPASGHFARDPTTGHLIYAAIADPSYSGSSGKKGEHTDSTAGDPPVYPPESAAMSEAVTAMQADSWGYTTFPSRSTYKFWNGSSANTRCRASCREYSYDSSEYAGATIVGAFLTINASSSIDVYRIKFAVSASSSPSDTWSVIHDSPHYTGSANGTTLFVPFSATLDDYFFIYFSADDYSALSLADPGYGSATTGKDVPIMNSGGNLRFVLTS
jgi:hypothetical protein